MRGFSGHLPPEQLLYLWDLILGYDSLEIIPLLAVTILSFRKENLMQVNTLQCIEVKRSFRIYCISYINVCETISGCFSGFIFPEGDTAVTISFANRVTKETNSYAPATQATSIQIQNFGRGHPSALAQNFANLYDSQIRMSSLRT